MYYLLPETENCTLEDIEIHFSNNQRKLTDRKIQKAAKPSVEKNGISSEAAKETDVKVTDEKKLNGKAKVSHLNAAFVPDS